MARKRVVVGADRHGGHRVGLTPPIWQTDICGPKYLKIQQQLWEAYKTRVDALKPIDIWIENADCIDGRGERSGGIELITRDRKRQCEIAAYGIKYAEAKTVVMTRGTPYHTGTEEDWEDILKDMVGAKKIGDHEWFDVNGCIFDVKHHASSSSVPHGRLTPISKERLQNTLWSEHEEQPKANIIIRSHVHYFTYCGEDDWLAVSTPALQGMGSRYGARQCSGTVHFGLIWFDIEDDGRYSWGWDIARVESQKAKALIL